MFQSNIKVEQGLEQTVERGRITFFRKFQSNIKVEQGLEGRRELGYEMKYQEFQSNIKVEQGLEWIFRLCVGLYVEMFQSNIKVEQGLETSKNTLAKPNIGVSIQHKSRARFREYYILVCKIKRLSFNPT